MKCIHKRDGFRTAAIITAAALISALFFGCEIKNQPVKEETDNISTIISSIDTNTTPVGDTTNTSGSETTQKDSLGKTDTTIMSTTKRSTHETGTTATSAPVINTNIRRIIGSFIQSWYVADWSQARWDEECKTMAQSGMKYIILQSIVDLNYDTTQKLGQDPGAYKLKGASSLYPSNLPELSRANNGVDSLAECLKACKKNGMQAIIGPLADDRWWLYGWGAPKMPSGAADAATQSYMAKWTEENADLSNRIASEVYEKYGKEYGSQIYCWYYNNEIWNIDSACAGTDNGVYAKILSNSLNLSLRHYSKITPDIPLLLSPFINPLLSTPDQCGKMWKNIIALTEFRKGDIFCPQDSFGGHTNLDLNAWWSNYKAAADTKPGLVLWANNENFRSNYKVARVDDFINKQVNVTAKYVEANICFSWNHYYSPDLQNPGYNAAYVDYITNGKLDSTAPSKPTVSVNSGAVKIKSSDNIGICGYCIYKDNQTNLVENVVCGQDDNWLNEPVYLSSGTYYICAYDFCGNKSEKAEVKIQ